MKHVLCLLLCCRHNDIVKQLSHDVQCTLYVDNFMIFVTATNEVHSSELSIVNVRDCSEFVPEHSAPDLVVPVKYFV